MAIENTRLVQKIQDEEDSHVKEVIKYIKNRKDGMYLSTSKQVGDIVIYGQKFNENKLMNKE